MVGVPQRQSAVLDLLIYTSNRKDDNEAYGRSLSARKMIIPAQMELGLYWDAMATYAQVQEQLGADTLHSDYALLLQDRARAARALGRPEEAYSYMQRYAALSSELANKLQESRVM